MSDLVSVLVPAHNAERWLTSTLRSALSQSWHPLEVIVVDDGSTDRTLEVAKSFEGRAVKVVTQENCGAPAARNHALALAQGRYVQWLDADDLLHPDKIAAQMTVATHLRDPRVLLSGSFGTFYYTTDRARFVETSLWRDIAPLDYFLTRFLDNTCFQTDAWLVSRELTETAGPWTDAPSPDDDGEYFCRLVTKSTGVKFVREAKSYYRVGNAGSLANRRSHDATVALFESKVQCIQYLLALEDTARTRAACVQLLQDWMFHVCEYEDVVAASTSLATELGGTLTRTPLCWKYAPIEWVWGYDVAFKAAVTLRSLRTTVEAAIDRLRYRASAPFGLFE